MRLLCVDLGDARTGLAVGDAESRIASPLGAIETPASREADLVAAIARHAEEQDAARILLGLPLNMDGTEGPRARIVRRFAESLRGATTAPVELHDERLSTAAADWSMANSGLTHKQKKARRDALAAAAILQDYLDHPPGSGDAAPSRAGPGEQA